MGFSWDAKGFLGRAVAAATLASCLFMFAPSARADIVLGPGSAIVGNEATLTVSGSFSDFSSALLAVNYDSTYLTFKRAEEADYELDLSLTPFSYWAQVSPNRISLALSLDPAAPVPVPNLLNYFKLVFQVVGVAPGGLTEVDLLDLDPTSPDPTFVFDTPAGFEEVRFGTQRVFSTVTTLAAATPMPIGNTLALALPSVGLLAFFRRRQLAALARTAA